MKYYFKQSQSFVISISAFAIWACCLALMGCSGPVKKAPIADAKQIPSFKINEHRVAKGETVYSIAWRYGVDYKKLAKANNLDLNYAIWPGQVLTLDLSSAEQKALAPAPKPTKKPHTPQQRKPVPTPVKPPSAPVIAAPVPSTSSMPKVKPAPVKKPVSVNKTGKIVWQWPINGSILVKFNQRQGMNKGIDIKGKLGESVHAAAAGEVVYAGSGLRGYGKLVIVKHSEKYLSAYAHNKAVLVKEGDAVKGGQTIAKVGKPGGSQQASLHFEIRHDGVPVDPMKYLPQK